MWPGSSASLFGPRVGRCSLAIWRPRQSPIDWRGSAARQPAASADTCKSGQTGRPELLVASCKLRAASCQLARAELASNLQPLSSPPSQKAPPFQRGGQASGRRTGGAQKGRPGLPAAISGGQLCAAYQFVVPLPQRAHSAYTGHNNGPQAFRLLALRRASLARRLSLVSGQFLASLGQLPAALRAPSRRALCVGAALFSKLSALQIGGQTAGALRGQCSAAREWGRHTVCSTLYAAHCMRHTVCGTQSAMVCSRLSAFHWAQSARRCVALEGRPRTICAPLAQWPSTKAAPKCRTTTINANRPPTCH